MSQYIPATIDGQPITVGDIVTFNETDNTLLHNGRILSWDNTVDSNTIPISDGQGNVSWTPSSIIWSSPSEVVPQGWQCPVCKSVYNPVVLKCGGCLDNVENK